MLSHPDSAVKISHLQDMVNARLKARGTKGPPPTSCGWTPLTHSIGSGCGRKDSEAEGKLPDRREASPVERCRPERGQRAAMFGRAVSLVRLPAIAAIL